MKFDISNDLKLIDLQIPGLHFAKDDLLSKKDADQDLAMLKIKPVNTNIYVGVIKVSAKK